MLTRLLRDPRVPSVEKVILGAAVAYALNPLDLIPDFIPLWGRLDDLLLISLAIERLLNKSGPELIRAHWDGPEEELVALTTRIDELARRLPGPIRRRLRSAVETR
ncbi:MAG: DUF1232 domain-containing protein [Gemmatimonadota bacterium]|nr:MAG: DUF1232 domain-containing protein [Gemmatimonadota bacterium]